MSYFVHTQIESQTGRHGENTSLAHILVVEVVIERQADMVGTLASGSYLSGRGSNRETGRHGENTSLVHGLLKLLVPSLIYK